MSCFLRFGRGGRSIMLRVPFRRRAMYWTVGLLLLFTPGCGPRGLALGMIPLPLAMSNRLPSGVTRTEVGYQPAGMKPKGRLLPGIVTSKTATVFTFALATKSVFSSGERARLFGVEPGGD